MPNYKPTIKVLDNDRHISSPVLKTSDVRPLNIDFDLYTGGDAEFKVELIKLMIENLLELQAAQKQTEQMNDHTYFLKARHKITLTISIINDHELTNAVTQLSGLSPTDLEQRPEWARLLNNACLQIISSLQRIAV